jgi:endogenous inhibitor of DNA gyrase (YacG/DUF329 family)
LPEWLIERGIGETRAALIDDGEIVEARIMLDGIARAGTIVEARLKHSGVPAIAVADEREYLLPAGAPGITEGGALRIAVTREAIPGAEPWKRPLARATAEPASPAAPLPGRDVPFPSPGGIVLDEAGWGDVVNEARSGIIRFEGGELRISPTPAMTLIDVDGTLPAPELAVAGARQAARAIRRLDIGGSIGIDLPTVGGGGLPPPSTRICRNRSSALRSMDSASCRSFAREPAPRCSRSAGTARRPRPVPCSARRRCQAPAPGVWLLIRRSSRCSNKNATGSTRWRASSAARSACAPTRRSPSPAAMPNPPKAKPCPLCGKPAPVSPGSAAHAPFCSRGCKDRDLLKWLGEGYRIPGPPVDPETLDSEEGGG